MVQSPYRTQVSQPVLYREIFFITPEAKQKIAEKARLRWANKDFKNKMVEKTRQFWADISNLEKMKEAAKKSWEGNDKRRATLSAKLSAHERTKEHALHISQALKARNATSPFKGQTANTNEMIAAKTEKVKQFYAEHPEAKKAISLRNAGVPKTDEHKKKLHDARIKQGTHPNAVAALGKYIAEHGPALKGETKFSHPGCQRIAEAKKKYFTPEIRELYSQRMLGRPWRHYRFLYDGPKGRISMRSSWEFIVATWLDWKKVDWKFEPKSFYVGKGDWDGASYIPDFFLPDSNTWIEVKGFYSKKNKRKMKAVYAQHPDLRIRFIFEDRFEKIKAELKKAKLFPDLKVHKILPAGALLTTDAPNLTTTCCGQG